MTAGVEAWQRAQSELRAGGPARIAATIATPIRARRRRPGVRLSEGAGRVNRKLPVMPRRPDRCKNPRRAASFHAFFVLSAVHRPRALCARALQPQRLDDFMTRGPLAKQGRKRSSRLVNQPLLVSVVHLPAHRRNERAQLRVIAAASRHSGCA